MIYKEGDNAVPTSAAWSVISPKDIKTGDYIMQYKAPVVTFRVLSPETITRVLKGWLSLKEKIAGSSEYTVEFKGAYINTDTGDIFIKVNVWQPRYTVVGTQQEGINYLAVAAIVGGVLVTLLGAVTLMYVFGGKEAVKAGAHGFGEGLGLAIGAGIVGLIVIVVIAGKLK